MSLPKVQIHRVMTVAPAPIQLKKTVSTQVALPCTQVIYDFKISSAKPIERIDIVGVSVEKILNILLRREVEVIICGGCEEKFQVILRGIHIEVVWGVAGELTDVLKAYIGHALTCGIGLVSSSHKKQLT